MKSSERCFRSEFRQPATLGRVALSFLATSILLLSNSAIAKELKAPVFLEPISNETVPSGRDVRLACVVDHLGSYKLAWIQQDRSAILTVGKHVITRNPRIGVMHDEHRTWYLLIRSVKPGDAGTYMCQINTEPVTSQIGVVNVVVPPYIKDEMTSNDVRLQEGSTVSLACSSRGSPIPTVKWKREDGRPIRINSTRNVEEVSGPILRLTHLIRSDMGAYLCIASNGVPPSVSKRIQVQVKFRPSVYAPHQLFGVILGQDAKLECLVEAWPPGLNYWKRPKGFEILHTDEKYNVSTEEGSQDYKTRMVLVVKNFTTDDIGDYNCISNNSQGGAEQVIRVSASTTIITNSNLIDKSHNNAKEPPQSSGKPALKPVNWSKESTFDERDHFLNRKKDKVPNSILEETKENPRAKNFFPLNTLEEDVDSSSAATATSASFSFIQNSFGFVIGMFAILSSQVDDWEEVIPNIRPQVRSKVVLNRRNELYPEFSNLFSEDYFLKNWKQIENLNTSCTENEYVRTRTECETQSSHLLVRDVRKDHSLLDSSSTKKQDPYTLKNWRTLSNYVPTFFRNTSITENILKAGCTLVWWFALHFLIDLATWKG